MERVGHRHEVTLESDSLGEGLPHHPSFHTECQAGPSTSLTPPLPLSRRSNKVGAQEMPSFQLTSFLTFLCSGRLSKTSLYMQPEHRGSEHLTHRSGRVPRLPRLARSLSGRSPPSGRMQSQVSPSFPKATGWWPARQPARQPAPGPPLLEPTLPAWPR